MSGLVHLMRCVGSAVLKHGVKALASAIPFGEGIFEIATSAYEDYLKDPGESDLRTDLQELAQASAAQVQQATEQAVVEVAAGQPLAIQQKLLTYLNQIPGAIRNTLRRTEDPTGTTIPPSCALRKPEELTRYLPPRPPRFNKGDRPMPGVEWELVELLGAGGFGEVWRAQNHHFPSLPNVALKFCLDPKAGRQLKHEASLLARVQSQGHHPGIVQLRHTYLSADPPCLEYELIEGGDLASAIYARQANKGPLPPLKAAKIILRLARTIGPLHKLNPPIVHRDIKPANVLVRHKDKRTEFLVTDFGIGGIVASQVLAQTAAGGLPMMTSMKGAHTPLYASPEQKRDDPPDPRDDVHALGVMWYQLLVGDFGFGVAPEWQDEVEQRRVPPEQIKLLGECIAGKAAKRLPTAADLAERLGNLIGRKETKQPTLPAFPALKTPGGQRVRNSVVAKLTAEAAVARLNAGQALTAQENAIVARRLNMMTRGQLTSIHSALGGTAAIGNKANAVSAIRSILTPLASPPAAPPPEPSGGITLADLIAAEILTPPLKLFRKYRGKMLEATLLADGGVEFQGHRYKTCSGAAEVARETVAGQRMNTNGWDFWQYEGGGGNTLTLGNARQQVVFPPCEGTSEQKGPPDKPTGVPRLPLPQARILQALLPVDGSAPSMNKTDLAKKISVSPTSGLIPVALHGRSASRHKGLLDSGYVTQTKNDKSETVYQITSEGIKAIEERLKEHGKLPPLRDKTASVNLREKK